MDGVKVGTSVDDIVQDFPSTSDADLIQREALDSRLSLRRLIQSPSNLQLQQGAESSGLIRPCAVAFMPLVSSETHVKQICLSGKFSGMDWECSPMLYKVKLDLTELLYKHMASDWHSPLMSTVQKRSLLLRLILVLGLLMQLNCRKSLFLERRSYETPSKHLQTLMLDLHWMHLQAVIILKLDKRAGHIACCQEGMRGRERG